MTTILLFLVKLTVVLLLGVVVTALLRTRSAASRHFAWTVTIGCSIALALATRTAPPLAVPLPQWPAPAPGADSAQSESGLAVLPPQVVSKPSPAAQHASVRPAPP